MHQIPFILWFTGLSGAGKTTIANIVSHKLSENCYYSYTLDGDRLREGINKDLGFTIEDRNENMRRTAEIAYLMYDAGLIVLTACITPLNINRLYARNLFPVGQFIEVFIDTPLWVCEERDTKGLYMLARSGLIKDFTGIDSPFETPINSEIIIHTQLYSPGICADTIIKDLNKRGLVS